jgi:hypothetical protein
MLTLNQRCISALALSIDMHDMNCSEVILEVAQTVEDAVVEAFSRGSSRIVQICASQTSNPKFKSWTPTSRLKPASALALRLADFK